MTVATAPERRHGSLYSLLWTLVRTDFKGRYHGTVGGFLWALMKPLSMFVVLLVVFSFVFAGNPRYNMDLLIGLFLYDFFGEATKAGLMSLHSKGYLLSKAKFPRWTLVVASISNALITLSILSVVIAVFVIASGGAGGVVGFGLFSFYILLYALIVIGFALTTSVLYLRYRDLNQVWDVVVQAGFFLAPIVYPLSVVPERFHFYMYLWPPTPVIQFSRAVLVDGNIPAFKAQAFLVLEAGLALAVGIAVFRRWGARAAEYL